MRRRGNKETRGDATDVVDDVDNDDKEVQVTKKRKGPSTSSRTTTIAAAAAAAAAADASDDSEDDADFRPSDAASSDSDSDSGSGSDGDGNDNGGDEIPDLDPDTERRIQNLWEQIKTHKVVTLNTKIPQSSLDVHNNAAIAQTNVANKNVANADVANADVAKTNVANADDVDNAVRTKPRHVLRKSHLAGLAAKFGLNDLARKLTTLEKSMLDWRENVAAEGDAATLQHHNKAGYVDRMEFLSRSAEQQQLYVGENVHKVRKRRRK